MSKGTIQILSRIESAQRAKDELTEKFIADKADSEYRLARLTLDYHDRIRRINDSIKGLQADLHNQEFR